jgi:hypothetical protein
MRPSLSKRAFIPAHLLDGKTVSEVRRRLNFDLTPFDKYASDSDNCSVLELDELKDVRFGYSVPRGFALDRFKHLEFADNTTFPRIPAIDCTARPRDSKQKRFFHDLLGEASKPGPQDILAIATTGSGKTVASLWLAAQLRTPTLIVVDSNSIAQGWLKNCRKLFGAEWTDINVGRVQQDTVNYKDKPFTLSLVQSLARRNYGNDFYSNFGFIVFDEVQVFGNATYAPVLAQFRARVKLGVTAENKGGVGGTVVTTHLGKPRVHSAQEVLKPLAWVLTYEHQKALNAFNDGVLVTSLTKEKTRNSKLAKLINVRGAQRGRKVLALSDRTAQLTTMRHLLIELGVAPARIGVYAGEYETGRVTVAYRYTHSDATYRVASFDTSQIAKSVIRKFEAGDHDILPVPKATMKKLDNVEFVIIPETCKPTASELDNIAKNCDIILATYRIFAKGIDVPELDMGVELSPYGNIKQPLGRVLRILEGKQVPEWYAIHDKVGFWKETVFGREPNVTASNMEQFFDDKAKARRRALKNAGAKVKHQ